MPISKPSDDPALRDGIASLPEMENIQLELPLLQHSPAQEEARFEDEASVPASQPVIRL
ncbi:hypothetical protein [Agrobacterium tumefaciens]|uniref:hypothetical protein n=1 Tax=Agrobacterium tumefaciens TaxID=358 RepID=UPI00287C0442|nr:hypothetical protein [Agrobacterium tumefaciens]MDS7595029.1 hypothetical protein [Agrobacterium tumefaciens]